MTAESLYALRLQCGGVVASYRGSWGGRRHAHGRHLRFEIAKGLRLLRYKPNCRQTRYYCVSSPSSLLYILYISPSNNHGYNNVDGNCKLGEILFESIESIQGDLVL